MYKIYFELCLICMYVIAWTPLLTYLSSVHVCVSMYVCVRVYIYVHPQPKLELLARVQPHPTRITRHGNDINFSEGVCSSHTHAHTHTHTHTHAQMRGR